MQKYKHIFFDLDETLWDFKRNSIETLSDIYQLYHLKDKGVEKANFYDRYHYHNNLYWELYRKGMIAREDLRVLRWTTTLKEFNVVDESLAKILAEVYLQILPTKANLYDDALEVLEYLRQKYSLHIITNGFEEIQFSKLNHSGITSYFGYVITSEMAGSQKPNKEIFLYALEKANASVRNSIFIGDSIEADINGAKGVGIDHVLFNPEKLIHHETVTHEIHSLSELKLLL